MKERETDLPLLNHLIIGPDIGLRCWVRLVVKLIGGVGFSTVIESSSVPRVERVRLHHTQIQFHAVPEVGSEIFTLQFTHCISICSKIHVLYVILFGGKDQMGLKSLEPVSTRFSGLAGSLCSRMRIWYHHEVMRESGRSYSLPV